VKGGIYGLTAGLELLSRLCLSLGYDRGSRGFSFGNSGLALFVRGDTSLKHPLVVTLAQSLSFLAHLRGGVNGPGGYRLTLLKVPKERLEEGGTKREVEREEKNRTNNDHLSVLVGQ
jgi:hypothetical protein